MEKNREIREIIGELLDKGYSYVNISSFLLNKGILSKTGKSFSKTGIVYYIKKYNIRMTAKPYINLRYLYFKKDRYYYLLDKDFLPINSQAQLWKYRNMEKSVERTQSMLLKDDFEANMNNYRNVISMLEGKKRFKVYNKRIRGDYPGRNLLAIGFEYKNENVILPKKDIFKWMRENDQFIIYSQSGDLFVRGLIQNENIVCSYNEDMSMDNFLKYIYVPTYNKNDLVTEEICSEEAFKIAVLKKGKPALADVRVKGEIKIPKFSLSDEELCRKINNKSGVKPLSYSDIGYVSSLYESLEIEHEKLKRVSEKADLKF